MPTYNNLNEYGPVYAEDTIPALHAMTLLEPAKKPLILSEDTVRTQAYQPTPAPPERQITVAEYRYPARRLADFDEFDDTGSTKAAMIAMALLMVAAMAIISYLLSRVGLPIF